jgi:hypothetical protein
MTPIRSNGNRRSQIKLAPSPAQSGTGRAGRNLCLPIPPGSDRQQGDASSEAPFVQVIHPLVRYDINPEENASSTTREVPIVVIAMYLRRTASWVNKGYNDHTITSADKSPLSMVLQNRVRNAESAMDLCATRIEA